MFNYLIFFCNVLDTKTFYYSVIILIIYLLYYKKYSFYIWRQSKTTTKGKRNIGKSVPAFPNGWFVLMPSNELKSGQTIYIDKFGRNLALFRGTDNQVYCLNAYCAHLGANLALGGVVKYDRCIQCPFHGWVFDGATGECVMGSKKTPKEAIKYEYCEDLGESEKGQVFKENSKKEKVMIKKYLVKEMSGFIHIWLHSVEEKRTSEPAFYPFDLSDYQKNLSHRGYSLNLVNSHVQDIAENGADFLHFLYVHDWIIPNVVKASWRPTWTKATDPNLREKLKHERQEITDFRMEKLDRFLNDKNKEYIGVLTLDNYLSVLGSKETFFFSLVAFQVGPGLVYLFMKGLFFELLFFQHTTTVDKYSQEVYHEIYMNNYIPYWLSALFLRLEAVQVQNDGLIWDNKKFGYQPIFNPDSEVDNKLKEWRTWYGQFYEGCKKAEQENKEMEW